MNITANLDLMVSILLAFIRVSGLFLMTPLFSIAQVPHKVKVILLLALTSLLIIGLDLPAIESHFSLLDLFQAAIQELIVGMVLGLIVLAAFAVFMFGGRILDLQMGFGVANLIDPSTNTQSPLIGTILNMMAVMTFFMLNGHHLIIKGLAYSFEQIPIGQGFKHLPVDAVLTQFGLMFVYGFMLVAPAVVTLLLVDVGFAIMARTMPQVNMFIVSLPLKILVGLTVLGLSLNYLSPLLKRVFESLFRHWELSLS